MSTIKQIIEQMATRSVYSSSCVCRLAGTEKTVRIFLSSHATGEDPVTRGEMDTADFEVVRILPIEQQPEEGTPPPPNNE